MPEAESKVYFLTIQEAGEKIRKGELSPVEVVQASLDRVEATDDRLHSFITLMKEEAMEQARTAEADILKGNYKGPLHGIPFALKDLYDTAGVRTTSASKVDFDQVPQEDATAAARLKAAGAVLMGKLSMHEYASGAPDFASPFPPARNPWNLDHVTGGSSSGSGSAVASGQVMGALGSCTGGSIRGPASLCGIVGIKPTYGRVSRHGVVTLSWSQDHCGPMTWTVRDAALMLQAIAGRDPKDPTTSAAPVPDYTRSLREDVKGLTIGVPRHFFFNPHPDVNAESVSIVEKGLAVLEELGANLEEVTIPNLEYARAVNTVIMAGEAYAFHEKNLKARPNDFGEAVRARFRIGALLSASDYVQAQRCRQLVKRGFAEVLRKVDLLATPTTAYPAQPLEGYDATITVRGPSFTAPFNVTGLPAISVPCGFNAGGLPVGMQIAGKPFDEPTVLRAAHTYEQHARWFERRPPI